LLFLAACAKESTEPLKSWDSPDEIEVGTEDSCPDCDDANTCTSDYCSSETGFACVHDEITPCCGNGICEDGEDTTNCANECPVCLAGPCETARFSYDSQICITKDVVPCCGNGICEVNETCTDDCIECLTDVECHESVFDYENQKCAIKPIVPCCGNDICDRGESCESCDDCICEVGTDLSDFPNFLSDGTLIVVGDTASSQDVLTATSLTTSMAVEGIDTTSNLYSLHSASALSSKDMIVLGRPCENSLWEEYQGIGCNGNYFEPDTALIKLIFENGREIVYVGGYSPDDTEYAVNYLLKNSLSGMEIELDT